MMLKIGMELAQYYTVFNCRPPRTQKYLNPQDRTILAGIGTKPATKFLSQGV